MTYFKNWIKKSGIRAVKTMAQTALSLFTVGELISDVNWQMVISVSVVAGVYSLLTSVAGLPELKENE